MARPIRQAHRIATVFLGCALGAAGTSFSQVKTTVPDVVPGASPATVERITVHGTTLEGNLERDAVDRPVIVILPPSYARDSARRYPVIYALHGYSSGAFAAHLASTAGWFAPIGRSRYRGGLFGFGDHAAADAS